MLYKMCVGIMGVNCYIAGDENEALIFDPGANHDKIFEFLQEKNIKTKYIILTHCHFDHILSAGKLQELTGAKLVVCEKEKENLADNDINMTGRFSKKSAMAESLVPDVLVSEGDIIKSGDYSFKVIETPGHTSGGMCLYCESEKVLFSGDTLFCESIGRSDFPTGNLETLFNSIREKLFCLPDDTRVLPGHEAETSILHEKTHNPYLR